MIYKIETQEYTNIELEACVDDKVIYIHIAQGYEDSNGNNTYNSFMNTSLNEKMCSDLIKALEYSLLDLKRLKVKNNRYDN